MSDIARDITEIARCGSQYKAENLTQFGLKVCHASYLMEICACPGISQDQLAQRICINKSNVARQAAVLEADGFISRRPSPTDKRVMELYPTEKALALLPQIQDILSRWESCITQGLDAAELDFARSLLRRMKGNASAWVERDGSEGR